MHSYQKIVNVMYAQPSISLIFIFLYEYSFLHINEEPPPPCYKKIIYNDGYRFSYSCFFRTER